MSTNATTALDPGRLHETRAPQLVTAIVICPTISALLVGMRIYTRVVLIRKCFLEDYSIAAASIFSVAMSVFMGLAVTHGLGRHIETVSAADSRGFSRVQIGVIQFYFLTHLSLKLSIMLQYYRVAVLPWEKRLCLVIIAILSAGYLAFLLVQMVRCIPFEAQWNPKYPGARCIYSTAAFFAAQGFNLGLDLLILVGPLFILRHSSAPLPQKMLFGIALAFGGAACVAGILRFQTLLPSTTSTDTTWDKMFSAFYGAIEVNLGIACACVVTVRPLFQRVRRLLSGNEPREPRAETDRRKFGRRPPLPEDLTLSSLGSTVLDSDGRADMVKVDTSLPGASGMPSTNTKINRCRTL